MFIRPSGSDLETLAVLVDAAPLDVVIDSGHPNMLTVRSHDVAPVRLPSPLFVCSTGSLGGPADGWSLAGPLCAAT